MSEKDNNITWTCSRCGEILESQFEICWNCGTTVEKETDPDFEHLKKLHSDECIYKGNPRPRYRILGYSLVGHCVLYFLLTLIYEYVFGIQRETFSELARFDIHCLLLFSLSIMILGILINLWTYKKDSKRPKYRLLSGMNLDEQIACPHCLTINHPLSYFCITCMTPLTSHACIDPLYRIYAQGNTYQEAAAKPTNFLVVLGMWLIFGWQIPFMIWGFIEFLSEAEITQEAYYIGYAPPLSATFPELLSKCFGLILAGVMLLLYIAIIVKVTWNYNRYKELKNE